MPTEEEWEYAARGTEGRTYPWGFRYSHLNAPLFSLCAQGRHDTTCAVGDYSAVGAYDTGDTPFGLEDMAGNVGEWTASAWSDDYSKSRTSQDRVVRGPHPLHDPPDFRAANREHYPPGTTRDREFIGFRCAK